MRISDTSNDGGACAAAMVSARGSGSWLALTQSELLTLALVVATANAMLPSVIGGISKDGLIHSLLNTFEISAIVWGALALGIDYGLQGSAQPVRTADKLVAVAGFIGSLLPFGPSTWVFVTGLALYVIATTSASNLLHRAGWVYLALTVPMFWSKRLFNFFSEFFLALDAQLVSSITGTQRISNLVPIPNGTGYLQIAAPCSSMANVSLAILCWVLFTQTSGVRWEPRNVIWCVLACASVVFINVTRISLIGFYPYRYDLLHGPLGSTVVSWLTIFVVFAICFYGVGRGRFKIV